MRLAVEAAADLGVKFGRHAIVERAEVHHQRPVDGFRGIQVVGEMHRIVGDTGVEHMLRQSEPDELAAEAKPDTADAAGAIGTLLQPIHASAQVLNEQVEVHGGAQCPSALLPLGRVGQILARLLAPVEVRHDSHITCRGVALGDGTRPRVRVVYLREHDQAGPLSRRRLCQPGLAGPAIFGGNVHFFSGHYFLLR